MGFLSGSLRLPANVPKEQEESARRDAAGYYGLCSAVDENIGRLLAELDSLKLTDNTIVVFTSDHGQMLGSQGMDGIDLPFEESSRIPHAFEPLRRDQAGRDAGSRRCQVADSGNRPPVPYTPRAVLGRRKSGA